MGIFYYIKSVALAEDLPLKESYDKIDDFYRDADRGYNLVSIVLMVVCIFYSYMVVQNMYIKHIRHL